MMGSVMGTLQTVPARTRKDLLATPVYDAIEAMTSARADEILVAPIDPDLADTAAFCEAYQVGLDESANCVVVAGKRDGETRFAACLVLATTRADVNGIVRKLLDVRKASFAPMDVAVSETGMEYGGITAIGLPADWPIFIDAAVNATAHVIIGSGVRRSKIALPGSALAALPNATVVEGLGR
jgi:prolyl-tRNA editing enzyme YbaK/EbsC (Cys-tRNA(Pro) deacylase)